MVEGPGGAILGKSIAEHLHLLRVFSQNVNVLLLIFLV